MVSAEGAAYFRCGREMGDGLDEEALAELVKPALGGLDEELVGAASHASRLPSSKPTVQALVSLGVVLQASIVSTASAVAVGWPAAADSNSVARSRSRLV